MFGTTVTELDERTIANAYAAGDVTVSQVYPYDDAENILEDGDPNIQFVEVIGALVVDGIYYDVAIKHIGGEVFSARTR